MAMFHRIETVALAHNRKMLETFMESSVSQQIYKNDTPPTIILPGFC